MGLLLAQGTSFHAIYVGAFAMKQVHLEPGTLCLKVFLLWLSQQHNLTLVEIIL